MKFCTAILLILLSCSSARTQQAGHSAGRDREARQAMDRRLPFHRHIPCTRDFRHARRARLVGVMSLYWADGRPPIDEARPLAMIADFEARCALGDDKLWRLQSHVLRPVFIGTDRPFSLMIDPERLRARSA